MVWTVVCRVRKTNAVCLWLHGLLQACLEILQGHRSDSCRQHHQSQRSAKWLLALSLIYIYIYIYPPASFRRPSGCEEFVSICLSQVFLITWITSWQLCFPCICIPFRSSSLWLAVCLFAYLLLAVCYLLLTGLLYPTDEGVTITLVCSLNPGSPRKPFKNQKNI